MIKLNNKFKPGTSKFSGKLNILKIAAPISSITILILMLSSALQCAALSDNPGTLIVDYDLTKATTDLHPGDRGTLIIVIKNIGNFDVENIKIWIPYSKSVTADAYWTIGTINPGQSTTLKTTVRVSEDAYIGTHTVTLNMEYKYYWYDSMMRLKVNTIEPNWLLMIPVKSNPQFTVVPQKTTYYSGIEDTLSFRGDSKDSVRDLTVKITSGCANIIGSSQKYIGNLNKNENFTFNYKIKPGNEKTCNVDVSLNYLDSAGNSTTKTINFGLNIIEPDVDLKILDISFGTPSPGDTIDLKIKVKNVGTATAESVTAMLDLNDPFVPVQTSELYIENINAGEEKEMQFLISINPDAEIKAYKIPLKINYKIGGVEYKDNKSIGVDIAGSVNLEVINVEIVRDKLRIEVANTGTRTANAVKATLTSGDLTKISYKDKLIPTKQTTFSFDVPREKTGKLVLEYTGSGNTRVSISENIPIPSNSLLSTSSETSPTGFPLWAIAAIVVIFAAVIYIFRKHF